MAEIIVASDHWINGGIVHGILARAGHKLYVPNARMSAQEIIRRNAIDLVIVYLSLGLENVHKKNKALPFAEWLVEQDGQCPPSVVLMRGYQDEPLFRVARLTELPFQGGKEKFREEDLERVSREFREENLPQVSREELPGRIADLLAQ